MFIVLEYFLLCVGFVMIVSFLSLPIFMEDRAIFQHESAMRLYPTFTYFISGLLCEVFVTTLQISLFGIMTYLSCYPTDRYQIKEAVIYVGVLIITACSSSSLAMVSVVTSTTLPRTLSTHGALVRKSHCVVFFLLMNMHICPIPVFFFPSRLASRSSFLGYWTAIPKCFPGSAAYNGFRSQNMLLR